MKSFMLELTLEEAEFRLKPKKKLDFVSQDLQDFLNYDPLGDMRRAIYLMRTTPSFCMTREWGETAEECMARSKRMREQSDKLLKNTLAKYGIIIK